MIIALSGTDGVGKTEQIWNIMRSFEEEKIRYSILYVRGSTGPLVSLYKRLFCKRKVTKRRIKIAYFLSMVELIFNWCVKIKLLDGKKRIVLCDRYLIDTEIDFAERFGEDFKRGFLWKFLTRHTPRADLSIYLNAEPEIIEGRLRKKGESEEREKIASRLSAYGKRLSEFDYAIDASKEKDELYEKISGLILPLARQRCDTPHIRRAKRAALKLSGIKDARVTAEPVIGGSSGAHNYSLSILGEKKYFLKLFSIRTGSLLRIAEAERTGTIVYPIKMLRVSPRRSMTIAPWIDGTPLPATMENAKILAEKIKEIHSLEPPKIPSANIRAEIFKYFCAIRLFRIDFPHKREILSFIKDNIGLASDKGRAIVHMDLHLNNILVDREGKIRLIDSENSEVTAPLREFIYAACFRDKDNADFWQEFLRVLFPNGASANERKKFSFFCHLHALRMIITCHKMGNGSDIVRVAESIHAEFHCDNNK